MSTDKPEEKKEKVEATKPPEAPAKEAVIGATPQQDRWKQMEQAHYLDQDESATGLFYKPGQASESTSKFGIDGLDEQAPKRNANGTPYVLHRAEASQAVKGLDPLSKPMTESAFQSSVKMQIQATQVPEVSSAVDPKDALKYTGKVMESGVAVVRQTESHMAQPNAINNDLINTAIHYSQSPYQLNQDLLTAGAAAIERLDKPMTVEQRAGVAGALMPLFFFDGHTKPVETEVAQQMKLEEMSADQLKALGIERVEMHMPEVPDHLKDLPLQPASPQLLDSLSERKFNVVLATEGSEDLAHMNSLGVSGLYRLNLSGAQDIVLHQNPSKISALEEFLHGTQNKLKLFGSGEREVAEFHVKDFMMRHHKLLGLSENDLIVIKALREQAIKKVEATGFRWKGEP